MLRNVIQSWPGPVFCLLLGVSSGCAWPITGLACDWPSRVWAYFEQETETRRSLVNSIFIGLVSIKASASTMLILTFILSPLNTIPPTGIYTTKRHNGLDGVSNTPASPLFTQPFIRAQIKENIKAPRHWPFCGEFTGDRWFPRTNGQ